VHPIIYVTGRSFSPAHDGLAKRFQIVSEYLGQSYAQHPRFLLASEQPLPDKQMIETGWQWVPISTSSTLLPSWWRSLWRGCLVANWRFADQRKAQVLALVGGSHLSFGKYEKRFFADKPGALVLIGRCELSGMVQFRASGQKWVLDSIDSVTNLEKTYALAEKWRRLSIISRTSWWERLRKTEYHFARQYDRIINLSSDDNQFFAAAAPNKVILEDTCIVLPEKLSPMVARYDVGYLGGTHAGSVKAAKNLISVGRLSGMKKYSFVLAGRVCEKLSDQPLPPNITLAGPINDSLTFLRQCRCVVLFSEQETGTSVKFQEAVAAGCVIIANRYAARFSQARAGETHLEVETMSDIAQLLSSSVPWKFRPRGMRDYFTRDAFYQRFRQAIGSMPGRDSYTTPNPAGRSRLPGC
jgi:hypothetical protein